MCESEQAGFEAKHERALNLTLTQTLTLTLTSRLVSRLKHECAKAHAAVVQRMGYGDLELKPVPFLSPKREQYTRFLMPPNAEFVK